MTWKTWAGIAVLFLMAGLAVELGISAVWAPGLIWLGVGLAWLSHPDRSWNQVDEE